MRRVTVGAGDFEDFEDDIVGCLVSFSGGVCFLGVWFLYEAN